jgi:hypothetical protein
MQYRFAPRGQQYARISTQTAAWNSRHSDKHGSGPQKDVDGVFNDKLRIFRGEELLIVGSLVYVYADVHAKKSVELPDVWRNQLR